MVKIKVIMYFHLRLSCPKFLLLSFEAMFQNRVLSLKWEYKFRTQPQMRAQILDITASNESRAPRKDIFSGEKKIPKKTPPEMKINTNTRPIVEIRGPKSEKWWRTTCLSGLRFVILDRLYFDYHWVKIKIKHIFRTKIATFRGVPFLVFLD